MSVDAAILSFTDWAQPWRFVESVCETLADRPAERAVFETMAAAASSRELWLSADLPFACKIAHREMQDAFPQLSDGAVAALVRAASYEWR